MTTGRTASRCLLAPIVAMLALGAGTARAEAQDATSGSPPETVAAACAGPRDGSVSAVGGQRFAQTFHPRVSGALTAVDLDVTKPPGSTGDWIVEIHLAVRIPVGNFEQRAVASTTIPDSRVPTGSSTITARFADPAIVFSGVSPRQEYELVVTRKGDAGLTVGYRDRGGCPGALSRSDSGPDAFSPLLGGTADLVFTAYVVDVAPPRTRIVSGPRRRTDRHGARFELGASEPVSGFRCRIDKRRLRPCGPTEHVRVGRGRHVLRARAIDVAGNADPTPARLRWRVTG
jgi:hypothetical protein